MDRKRVIPLMMLAATLCSTTAKAQSDDWGVWTTVTVEKKLTKKWSVNAEGEYRTRDGVSATERWSGAIGTDYKFFKWLKADIGYTYIHSRQPGETTKKGNIIPGHWLPRHRFNASITGSIEWNRFKFSLRERWQYTYRPQQYVEKYDKDDGTRKNDELVKAKAEHMVRSRLQIEYDIAKCDFTPYVSCELYHNSYGIDKTRWTAGTEYKINKKHSVEAYYRYQDKADDDESNGHVIGVGYKFKF